MTNEKTPVAGYSVTIPGELADFKLTIPGKLPGLNEYTEANRRNAHQGAKMKRDNQDLVMWQILSQLRRRKINSPVFLLYTFIEPDRRRDHDNVSSFAHKVIQDALVEAGVLKNDGWGNITGNLDKFEVDAHNPRIVVEFIVQEVRP